MLHCNSLFILFANVEKNRSGIMTKGCCQDINKDENEKNTNGDRIMKKMMRVLALVGMMIFSGCQVDYKGPEFSSKWIRESENQGEEWKSRNTGVFAHPMYSQTNSTKSMLPMVGN